MLCKTQAWAAEILDLGFLRGSEQVRSLRAQWYFSRILLSFQVSFNVEKNSGKQRSKLSSKMTIYYAFFNRTRESQMLKACKHNGVVSGPRFSLTLLNSNC